MTLRIYLHFNKNYKNAQITDFLKLNICQIFSLNLKKKEKKDCYSFLIIFFENCINILYFFNK